MTKERTHSEEMNTINKFDSLNDKNVAGDVHDDGLNDEEINVTTEYTTTKEWVKESFKQPMQREYSTKKVAKEKIPEYCTDSVDKVIEERLPITLWELIGIEKTSNKRIQIYAFCSHFMRKRVVQICMSQLHSKFKSAKKRMKIEIWRWMYEVLAKLKIYLQDKLLNWRGIIKGTDQFIQCCHVKSMQGGVRRERIIIINDWTNIILKLLSMIGQILFWNIRSVISQNSFERLIDLNRRYHFSFTALFESFQDLKDIHKYRRRTRFENVIINSSSKIFFLFFFWNRIGQDRLNQIVIRRLLISLILI